MATPKTTPEIYEAIARFSGHEYRVSTASLIGRIDRPAGARCCDGSIQVHCVAARGGGGDYAVAGTTHPQFGAICQYTTLH